MGFFGNKKSMLDRMVKTRPEVGSGVVASDETIQEQVHVPIQVEDASVPVSIPIEETESFELMPTLKPKKLSVSSTGDAVKPVSNPAPKHVNVTYLQEFPEITQLRPEQYFNLVVHSKLATLHDLHRALGTMTTDEWSRHVDSRRNEFADWIEREFHNIELAQRARVCGNAIQLRDLLGSFQ